MLRLETDNQFHFASFHTTKFRNLEILQYIYIYSNIKNIVEAY